MRTIPFSGHFEQKFLNDFNHQAGKGSYLYFPRAAERRWLTSLSVEQTLRLNSFCRWCSIRGRSGRTLNISGIESRLPGFSAGISNNGFSARVSNKGFRAGISNKGFSARISYKGLSAGISNNGFSTGIYNKGFSARISCKG